MGRTPDDSLAARRRCMVELQIEARGIRSPQVLAAMAKVPREAFVAAQFVDYAYEDYPLPIDERQTISQPYIVAFMVEALQLQGGERVLEIGTGSGYAAAVLAEIAAEVYTVERFPSLARAAARRLAALGYADVHVVTADGTAGLPRHAPYDAIVVAAATSAVPPALRGQLSVGGRLVLPLGADPERQDLVRVTREDDDVFHRTPLLAVRFVPLVGGGGEEDQCRAVDTPGR
jgi:protein-L-isoaspartate(D-aspartate) O-methyltransferase